MGVRAHARRAQARKGRRSHAIRHATTRAFDEGYELAREAATKAIAQDPDYAPAHATLGWIARAYDRDLQSAAQHYEHALTLDPANASSIAGAAILAENLGRLDTAIALSEYAVERDPVNPASYFNLAAIYHTARRPDDAIATLRTLFRLSPGHVAAQHGVGVELMLQSRHEAALAAMRDEPDEGWRLMGVAMVEHALGRAAESHAALTELVAKYEKDSAYNIAYVCAVRGEADRAFEWLEKARTYNDPVLPTIEVEPLFDGIHDDPRWLPFLRSIGKAPGQLAAITFDVQLPGKEPREGSGD